ncbi:hypothetical protein [Leptolyngbya sp. Cla-17]|uniref:hypothetical protein n=1 Tax=Leptolyngbya sp. Cla-17 TaxID=2803751 RepID=UPI0014931197|nr:hypothetical protein [Leptolyngbya sp. Cla-17]
MGGRALLLVSTTIVPGLGAIALCVFFLFPEWAALDRSYQNYQKLATSGAAIRELSIAQAAENRHRINCFAEGIGVLLGGIMVSIGVHGLCSPRR